jgi:hypothetical protein
MAPICEVDGSEIRNHVILGIRNWRLATDN